ncbi:general secretion pathway protein B [Fontimonas thermophila]|uniref:General secretion pathway protein B n=1 Tax=Fontimonas thermophila TaxID=1076937 RepID=A0A1I2IIU8_9GAMM|nr:general secretion pathway protein GspB [Fontimonas thermophila]SFF40786.1 general secretion pathway protein B [Fontimonas thermophila]
MSYILDALRRAERERTLGQAPSAETLVTVAPPVQRRNPRLLALAAATLILLLAMLAAWWLRRPPAPAQSMPAPAAQPQPGDLPQPILQAAAADAESPPLGGLPVFEDDSAIATLDDVTPPFQARAPDRAATPPPAVEQSARPAETSAPPSMPEPTAPTEPPAQIPDTAKPEPPLPPSGAPPLLRDMPPAFRAQFPALNLQVHVYDPLAEKRWVMIDGRRYREGQALDSGPVIVDITPDGVVFELQGERVFWPLVR